jgi:hypothetical protein
MHVMVLVAGTTRALQVMKGCADSVHGEVRTLHML